MKIRSITCFYHPGQEGKNSLPNLAKKISELKKGFIESGWDVQTTRLATVPFGTYTTSKNLLKVIHNLEKVASELGFDYLSIGPARISHPEEYTKVSEILSATENVFTTGMLTHKHKGIAINAVNACAEIITQAAQITDDGFTNLRFSAMSGVEPFTPFFPAAYSYGSQPAFALAIEAADAAISAFKSVKNVADGKIQMLQKMNGAAEELNTIIKRSKLQWVMPFKGFDFSLAPYPEDWCSLALAIENLGVKRIGMMGSLAAASILAETLDRGRWKKVGFNGLMLPVLEDSILADRSVEGTYSVKDLLLYSTVCGTGLDTVPLPGDISSQEISPLLMDIAALSLRLNKPLTARLMPVPGLKMNEMTHFDFDFFKNGKVLNYSADKLSNIFTKSEWIQIKSRRC